MENSIQQGQAAAYFFGIEGFPVWNTEYGRHPMIPCRILSSEVERSYMRDFYEWLLVTRGAGNRACENYYSRAQELNPEFPALPKEEEPIKAMQLTPENPMPVFAYAEDGADGVQRVTRRFAALVGDGVYVKTTQGENFLAAEGCQVHIGLNRLLRHPDNRNSLRIALNYYADDIIP